METVTGSRNHLPGSDLPEVTSAEVKGPPDQTAAGLRGQRVAIVSTGLEFASRRRATGSATLPPALRFIA